MTYTIEHLRSGWDQAAQQDPMFQICTWPDKAGGGWTEKEFFAVGRKEISEVMLRLADRGFDVHTARALDFGCGLGRLTQALARYFNVVDGVDISPKMIDHARDLNRHGKRVRYHVNDEDLSLFNDDTFDFVYTMVVLQHMVPEISRRYIREFFRVVRPGGLVCFEIPEGPDLGIGNHWLTMYPTPRADVEALVEELGADLLDVELACAEAAWQGWRYTARKREEPRGE